MPHRSNDQHRGGGGCLPTGGSALGGGGSTYKGLSIHREVRICGCWTYIPELEKQAVRILLESFLVCLMPLVFRVNVSIWVRNLHWKNASTEYNRLRKPKCYLKKQPRSSKQITLFILKITFIQTNR